MLSNGLILAILLSVISLNIVQCAEYVPVYIWGSNKLGEHEPALHKISEDSFKDTLLDLTKSNPYILVFAERTLSPEDFVQRQNGKIAFENLNELRQSTNFVYKPYVQNPIGAVKHLGKAVDEISIASLLNNPNVPKENVLIIELNDAREDEHRFHMLKRHDADIVAIYKDLLAQHTNILVIYTARHTSWIVPAETAQLKVRSLQQAPPAPAEPDRPPLGDEYAIFYTSGPIIIYTNNSEPLSFDPKDIKSTKDNTITTVVVNTATPGATFTFKFEFDEVEFSYYTLTSLEAKYSGNTLALSTNLIQARTMFSYHCNALNFTDSQGSFVQFPDLQIQPFTVKKEATNLVFDDAYDCVNFTTIPIWSGLFVTALMLIILTFGITMLLEIRTMDRFDDPKGKTITISGTD